jgi:septum formation inhibitor-activating ATPase MinD
MLDVADRIICAEHVHADYIIRKIDKKYIHKIEIMKLEDTEPYMSEQLIGVLEEKFKI